MYTYNNSVFDSTEFALTYVEVMIFRALLLVERVTSTNSEAFSNSSLVQIWSGRKRCKSTDNKVIDR